MPKETFTALCRWTRSKGLLADNRRVSVEEQIAMFLAVVTRNESRPFKSVFSIVGRLFAATSS
jgi:hypothetical protein